MDVPSTTAELIASVHARAGEDAAPLALVTVAAETATAAGRAADGCVDHFVAAARTVDISWTAIGEALGVSKQAARQRFAPRVDTANPFADPSRTHAVPSLETCLETARQAAAAQNSTLGTQHLLLGLLQAGTAAGTLARLGVTQHKIREACDRLFPATRDTDAPTRPRTIGDGAAEEAMERAAQMTVQRGQVQVRTEVLLFALAIDPDFASARVLADLGVSTAHVKKELDCRLGEIPRRKRLRGPARRQCAFCGTRLANRAMVAGPGVWICSQCVTVATDILTEDPLVGTRP